jgi:hypothetical protein
MVVEWCVVCVSVCVREGDYIGGCGVGEGE